MSNLKLHPALSGNNAAAAQQLSAPAPTTPVVPGAGPSLHGAMGLDADGFPIGTPPGVKAVMTPQEFLARHPQAQPMPSPVPSPSPVAPQPTDLNQITTDFYKTMQKRP